MLSAMSHVAASVPATGTTNSTAQSPVPGHIRTELLLALAVFFAACLYLWPLRDFVTFNANEGITLAGAERILQGQVPYRDFFSFVTPGSPYLMALWFKLFGSSFVVARSVMLVYAGMFAAITYLLARRMGSRSAALFAAALLTLGCIPFDLMALHNWDSTLFALLAIYCAHSLLEEPSYTFCVLPGVQHGAHMLDRTIERRGTAAGSGHGGPGSQAVAPRRRPVSRAKFWLGVAGFAIPLAITLAYFASQQASRVMLEDWLWPLQHYSAVNHSIYGALPVAGGLPTACVRFLGSTGDDPCVGAPMLLVSRLCPAGHRRHVLCNLNPLERRPAQAMDARVLGGCVFLGNISNT